jgi:hypothetical protein
MSLEVTPSEFSHFRPTVDRFVAAVGVAEIALQSVVVAQTEIIVTELHRSAPLSALTLKLRHESVLAQHKLV